MQVLLTRPLAQVQPLIKIIKNSGDSPLLFPTLLVEKLAPKLPKKTAKVLIFISANAVDFSTAYLKTLDLKNCVIATVGQVTKKRLLFHGFEVDICPEKNASSQALLETEYFKNLSHTSVLIIRGTGGVQTLKNTLIKQNNSVEYLEVYRRITPVISPEHKTNLRQFLSQNNGIILIHSVDSLESFIRLCKNILPNSLTELQQYPLVLFSHRIEVFAKKLGFKRCFSAKKSDDQGLLSALILAKKYSLQNHL